MDTIVIHLNQPNGYLAGILRDLAKGQCKDFVEWIDQGGANNMKTE